MTPARVALAAAALAAACDQGSRPEVGVVLAARPDAAAEAGELRARARALGFDASAAFAADAAEQRAQVARALDAGARVLVLEPVGEAAAAVVADAHERGARVIAYDRELAGADVDGYVAHDAYRIGVLQAEAALAATGGAGRYAIVRDAAGVAAAEIARGYEHTLAPHVARGAVELVDRPCAPPSGGAARPGGAGACEPGAAPVDAVLATSAGAGAGADALDLACQDRQGVVVRRPRLPLARAAAELARRLLTGDDLAGHATIELGGRAVPFEPVRVEPLHCRGRTQLPQLP